jgi:hypothetical protein
MHRSIWMLWHSRVALFFYFSPRVEKGGRNVCCKHFNQECMTHGGLKGKYKKNYHPKWRKSSVQ